MRDIDGYPYNFQIYKGKETGPKRETLGPRIVEDMARIIRREDADKHILYFDNFFTCHQLLDNLVKKNESNWNRPDQSDDKMSSQHSEKRLYQNYGCIFHLKFYRRSCCCFIGSNTLIPVD